MKKNLFKSKQFLYLLGIVFLIIVVSAIYETVRTKHNEFIRVGDMNIARSGHKAVLLKDGRVLIYGGAVGGGEIYDFNKRKFKLLTDDLIKASGETVTLLDNGLVLITGSKKSELFDPMTEKYNLSGNLNFPRYYFAATLLKNGKVLITGGELINPRKSPNEQKFKYAEYSEIYDPATGKFEIGPKMNIPRSKHSSILLNDGNVLIVGGISNNKAHFIPELYISKKNQFLKLKEKSYSSLTNSSPLLLKTDKVLISSQDSNNKWESMLEIYNSKTREFMNFSHNPGRYMGTTTLLKNGNIIFIAGTKKENWYGVSTKDSIILLPETKQFIKGPELTTKRSGPSTTLLNDGTVLITGGYNNQNMKSIKTSELYIP